MSNNSLYQRQECSGLLLACLCIVACTLSSTQSYAGSNAPEIPAKQVQLFLDDALLERTENVERVWHACQKHPDNPLIQPSGPEDAIFLLGSVLKDTDPKLDGESVYRMWYFAAGYEKVVEKPSWHVTPAQYGLWCGYAYSEDGLNWVKPNLHMYEVNGSMDNNAVYRPEGWLFRELGAVIKDPNPAASKAAQYKMLFMGQKGSIEGEKHYVFATSPDGYDWTIAGTYIPERPAYVDASYLVWHPSNKHYAVYCRAGGGENRTVALCTSEDFQTWETAGVVLDAQQSGEFGPDAQIYGMAAFPHGGQWLGFPMIYRGTNELGIAHSRDGRHWGLEKHLVVPAGEVGSWDAATIYKAHALVPKEDESWLYYGGRMSHHVDRIGNAEPQWKHGIGLAIIRRDGWCSLEPTQGRKGTITSKAVKLPDGRLYLNANAASGTIRVRVLDMAQEPIEGLEAHITNKNGADIPIEFQDPGALSQAVAQPVHLEFVLEKAALYAWIVQ